MFAKGGKTKGTDIIKGIQKILGVDDNQMAELWQVGINKYGSEEGIAQALNEATKGLTPQSSPDEIKAAVATVFSTGSEMFKCGGKLQKLAKRFAKGSSIDCGCNGTKLKQNGGLLNNRFYNLPDRVYNEKGVFSGYINGPEDVAYIQSRKEPRDWTVQSPTPQARLNNTTNQSRMLWNPEKLPEPYYTAYVITENPEGKGTVAHIPMNQDGGEVTEAANGVRLTRRQARDLSKQNKGYSNSQYTTAYYNALDALRRNSDLRGKDLRNQARIMASGINPDDNIPVISSPTPQVRPVVASAKPLNEVKTKNQALEDLARAVIRGNYGNGTERREALGDNYDAVQAIVSRMVNANKSITRKESTSENKQTVTKTQEKPTNAPAAEQTVNGPMLWNPTGEAVFIPISQRIDNKSITSQEAEAEWLKTHYPNGAKRNFITRIFQPYVVRNSVPEGSPLFIGPESPAHREARLRYESSIRHQKGGIVKGQNSIPGGMPALYKSSILPKDAPERKTGAGYTLSSFNRGGGGNTSDFGEIVTDENGLSYRDVRDTDWNTAFGELSQSYHREYVPNKAYKKAIKRGFKPIYDNYTPQQTDSLKTAFNSNFGNFGTANEDGSWGRDTEKINKFGVPIRELDYDEKLKNRLFND